MFKWIEIVGRIIVLVGLVALVGCSGKPSTGELEKLAMEHYSKAKLFFTVEKVAKTNGREVSKSEYLADFDVTVKFNQSYEDFAKETTSDHRKQGDWLGMDASQDLKEWREILGGPWKKDETRVLKKGLKFLKTEKGWVVAQEE